MKDSIPFTLGYLAIGYGHSLALSAIAKGANQKLQSSPRHTFCNADHLASGGKTTVTFQLPPPAGLTLQQHHISACSCRG